jgi:hypothetical protein
MPAQKVSTPLTDRLPWLIRWDKSGRQFVGVACLLPDCTKVVPRYVTTYLEGGVRKKSAGRLGAPRWFCTDDHAHLARDRREQLTAAIADLKDRLDSTPLNTRGVNRRELESDLAYLRRALAAYPAVGEIRPEAADRRSRRKSHTVA